MAFEAEEVYPNKRLEVGDQRTFAMAFPFSVLHRVVGNIVIEFEKKNLKVEEMQLMGVRRNFAKRHLDKFGRTPTLDSNPSFDWLNCITNGPVVVMILRGDDAVNKACEVVSNERRDPICTRGSINYYTSDSVKSVNVDIAMWFNHYRGNRLQKDMFYAFANGSVDGEEDIFKGSVKALLPSGINSKFEDDICGESTCSS